MVPTRLASCPPLGHSCPPTVRPSDDRSGDTSLGTPHSGAKGEQPRVGESGKDFAKRLLDDKYGEGNWKKGTNTEYSKIQKWGDRSFE